MKGIALINVGSKGYGKTTLFKEIIKSETRAIVIDVNNEYLELQRVDSDSDFITNENIKGVKRFVLDIDISINATKKQIFYILDNFVNGTIFVENLIALIGDKSLQVLHKYILNKRENVNLLINAYSIEKAFNEKIYNSVDFYHIFGSIENAYYLKINEEIKPYVVKANNFLSGKKHFDKKPFGYVSLCMETKNMIYVEGK